MDEVVITSVVRTPIGNFMGRLREFSATDLGALAIREAIRRSEIADKDIDEVIMGNVLPHGLGQNPARQAAVKAGLPMEVGALTINKVCGSGLKAVMLAAQAIVAGDAQVVIAGGMESMSRAPYYLDKARQGYRLWDGTLIDAMVHDGLWDVVNDFHMGYTAELVAQKFNVSREDQDRFAFESNSKATRAAAQGKFVEEILPVEIRHKREAPASFDADEGPRTSDMDALAALKPVFKENGTVTPGNSSKISDGASAVAVMSMKRAKELGAEPIAVVGIQATAGVDLKDVLVAPIESIPKALRKAGTTIEHIDLFEINEAFAASTLAVVRELSLDARRVNVRGGAIALGHPIGASGARVLTTLIFAMKERDAKTGMASLCLGGGEAVSLMVER